MADTKQKLRRGRRHRKPKTVTPNDYPLLACCGHMETAGSASREAVSGHDTPSSVSSSARRHCQYRGSAQRPQWRREGQHRSVSHLCPPRPASHGILRAQSKVTVAGLARCCLTLRSSGAPTAKCQARSGGTRYIFASPGLAFSCRRPLSSNVRPHQNPPCGLRIPYDTMTDARGPRDSDLR